jgi:hypothetical protein
MIKPDDTLILDYLKSILPSEKHTLQVEQISSETHNLVISSYQKYTRSYKQVKKINNTLEQKQTISTREIKPKKNKRINTNTKTFIIDSEEVNDLESYIDKNKLSKYTTSLNIQAKFEEEPLDKLLDLTPTELWQEILAKLLKEGIGRLYFEVHQDFGQIIITKNGSITTWLEKVDLKLFRELFKAMKTLANLPDKPLEKSRKIEIERIYQQKRLLLRFHLFPGGYGEQGTIQVLRDKALSFYQEQQMDNLGEQVLRLSKLLEIKIQQIQDLKRINPTELECLPQLKTIQAHILEKLEELDF